MRIQLQLFPFLVILFFLSLAFQSVAQVYTFAQRQATYQELATYQSLSADEVLGDGTSSKLVEINLDFEFKFFKNTYNSMIIGQGELLLTRNKPPFDGSVNAILPFLRSLASLNKLVPNFSEVKYATTGTPGNRILIVEWKRAGIYDSEVDEIIGYVSFQARLFEKNGDIEFHYGPSFLADEFLCYQEIGVYKWGKTPNIEGIGLYGDPVDLFVTDKEIPDFPFPMNDIPQEGTIYHFGYDRDLVWNNLNFMGWEVINGVAASSGRQNLGMVRKEIRGALLGHNFYKDQEFAEKYFLSEKAVIKGMVTQNYGSATSKDSASFSIYAVAPNGLPGNLLVRKKEAYRCLNLTGKLNFISFDTPLTVTDSFFVAFGLSPYEQLSKDTVGLYFTLADDSLENYNYGRTAFRWFDNNWYDTYSTKTITNRIGIDIYRDFLIDNKVNHDRMHLAVFPVVNFNTENTSLIDDNLNCPPPGQRQLVTDITEEYIEHNGLKLHPCFPNPANTSTTLNVSLQQAGNLTIFVYDAKGNQMLNHSQEVDSGLQSLQVDTSGFPPGIYLYVVHTGKATLASRFMVQKP